MSTLRPRFSLRAVTAVSAAALLLASCGSDADQEWPVDITLASQPNGAGLPFYIAEDQGFFEEEGLNVTIENYASGPSSLAAGGSDEWQAGWQGAPPALTGANAYDLIPAGIMIREDANHIMFMDSDVLEGSSPGEALEEHAVATSQNSLAEQTMRACADSLGASSSDVELVPLDGGAVVQALQAGRVSVANSWASPSWPLLQDDQYEEVCSAEDAGVAVLDPFVVTPKFAEEQPEAAAAFLRAAYRANEFINADLERAVNYMVEYYDAYGITGPREQAEYEVNVRDWYTLDEAIAAIESGETEDGLYASAEFFVENGVYPTEPPIDELLGEGLELLEAARDGRQEETQ